MTCDTRFMRHTAVLLLAAVLCSGCGKENELAAPPPDAIKTPSGISSKILRVGLGETHPGPQSTVTVHYTGWTAADGQEFDSSMPRANRLPSGSTKSLPAGKKHCSSCASAKNAASGSRAHSPTTTARARMRQGTSF